MSTILINKKTISQLVILNSEIERLNRQKVKVIFCALGIVISDLDFVKLMEWQLVKVSVPDKQMAMQLNRLCTYVPNLLFVTDAQPIFSISQGIKKRRVWKER